jgi:RNA polymerase sigma-70 factor (ECF subfamily)
MTLSRKQRQPANRGEHFASSDVVPAEKDPHDFDRLFREHWERVCEVLNRLVGDQVEAEDLALDVFWRMYVTPPADHRNLGGWLYRVATNLGFNAMRARNRRKLYEDEAGFQALEESQYWDPAKEIELRQERELVRYTLSRMKPRSAQILILRYSGCSYAEIAEAAGVSPTSVGALLARAEREFEAIYQKG